MMDPNMIGMRYSTAARLDGAMISRNSAFKPFTQEMPRATKVPDIPPQNSFPGINMNQIMYTSYPQPIAPQSQQWRFPPVPPDTKKTIPSLMPGGEPIRVFTKQYQRILKMREKRLRRMINTKQQLWRLP